MAVPFIPLTLLGAAGYAVYRGLFHVDRSHRSNARNGWTNEAFAQREKDRARDAKKGKRK